MNPTKSRLDLLKFTVALGNNKDSKEKYEEFQSYNEEFYQTIKSNYLPPISTSKEDKKLFYNFEQNNNASVSSSTGQLIQSLEDAKNCKNEYIEIFKRLQSEIKSQKKELEVLEEIRVDFMEDIDFLKNSMSNFINEQKKENFRLQREVHTIEKENVDIQNNIYYYLGRLNALEKEVGLKSKGYTYYNEQLESGMNAKFIIELEDI